MPVQMSPDTILKMVKEGVMTIEEARTLLGLRKMPPAGNVYSTKANAGTAVA